MFYTRSFDVPTDCLKMISQGSKHVGNFNVLM